MRSAVPGAPARKKNPSPSLSSGHRDAGKCVQALGQLKWVTSKVNPARVSSDGQKQVPRM